MRVKQNAPATPNAIPAAAEVVAGTIPGRPELWRMGLALEQLAGKPDLARDFKPRRSEKNEDETTDGLVVSASAGSVKAAAG